jgi:hypothetical protein
MYVDILLHLRGAVKMKRPEKWIINNWFLLSDNAPVHRSVFVKDFSTKNNVTTQEHPPQSPDLAPVDLYLFLRLKSALTGGCFSDATDIIKNTTKEVKRITQHGLQEYFQHLYSRRQSL